MWQPQKERWKVCLGTFEAPKRKNFGRTTLNKTVSFSTSNSTPLPILGKILSLETRGEKKRCSKALGYREVFLDLPGQLSLVFPGVNFEAWGWGLSLYYFWKLVYGINLILLGSNTNHSNIVMRQSGLGLLVKEWLQFGNKWMPW